MTSSLDTHIERILHGRFGAGSRLLAAADVDPAHVRDVARSKRFIERFMGDRAFRTDFEAAPAATAARHGLGVDVEAVRPFWDAAYDRELFSDDDLAWSPSVARYRLFILEKLAWRERWQQTACAPAHPLLRDWRRRQMARCEGELGRSKAVSLVHAPFAVELSRGCSIGCWFCGLSAERRQADFAYAGANVALWRDVLAALAGVLGAGTEGGFLYWATDPLDNPDYERFAADLAERFGAFPQTTTAQAHKHVPRVRRLLGESRRRGCVVNRFSVLTRSLLDRLHAEFSPEELLYTELLLQYGEVRGVSLTGAGSARNHERLERIVEASRREHGRAPAAAPPAPEAATIACVSGFLVSMVERRVQLVTPCPSSDRWPKGYWVLDEASFRSGAELADVLERMVSEHARPRLGLDDRVALRPDLTLEIDEQTVRLRSPFVASDLSTLAGARAIAPLVAEGGLSVREVALRAEAAHGIELDDTLGTLHQLFRHGLLDEEPRPRASAPLRAAAGAR